MCFATLVNLKCFVSSTVAVFTCHSCQRMFGTNAEPGQTPTHCRKCQPNATSTSSNVVSPSPLLNSTSLLTEARKQLKKRVSKRSKLNPMVCRLCGISFFYRRCMLRHLRENHAPIIDHNRLDDYIEIVPSNSQDDTNSSQSGSLDVTIESQLEDQSDFGSTANTTSVSVLNSGNHDNLSQPLDISVTSSSANFIDATAQSLQAVEQVLLSSQESVQSHQGNNGLEDSSTLLSHISPTDSSDIDIGGVKVTTTVRTTDTGSTFREYKCTICNKAFDRPYRLTRHLEIHDPNRPRIPCNYCTKAFTRKDSLESHIKTVHTSVHPYTCTHETCNRTFSTRSMYLNHQKVHGETKPYHCQECEESFTLLAELKDHLKKIHSETEECRCTECFKVCLSLEDLERHKMYDHRFECEVCGKIFARLAYLQVHVKVHNGQSKFNCRFCSDGFNSIYAYRQHMKTHPEYRRVINAFPCHACNKVFNDPSDLITHYQTEEHKEKAATIGTPVGTSTALSMMEGDLSVMNDLVTQVVMNDSEDMIHNIVDSQGTYNVTTH